MRWFASLVAILAIGVAGCGGSETTATVSSVATTPTTATTTTTTEAPTTTATLPPTTTTTVPPAGPARYRLVVDNTWSEETHPGALPSDAHLSWLAGATHDETASIWAVGSPSTPGITEMAETGVTDILVAEIEATDGVGLTLDWPWWFCAATTTSSKCGDPVVEFEIDPDHPYLTLSAMIGPSPDWFVGVDSLHLLEDGRWLEEVVVALTPFDGGTRNSNRLALFGPRDDPPGLITPITAASGQLIGPQQIGSYTLTLIDDS